MIRQFGSPQSCRNTLVTHSMKEIFKILDNDTAHRAHSIPSVEIITI